MRQRCLLKIDVLAILGEIIQLLLNDATNESKGCSKILRTKIFKTFYIG